MGKRQSGLYRLRDTTGDDQFDEVKLLRELTGPMGDLSHFLRRDYRDGWDIKGV